MDVGFHYAVVSLSITVRGSGPLQQKVGVFYVATLITEKKTAGSAWRLAANTSTSHTRIETHRHTTHGIARTTTNSRLSLHTHTHAAEDVYYNK